MREAVRPPSPIGAVTLRKSRFTGHVALIATPQPFTQARSRACLPAQLTVIELFRVSLAVGAILSFPSSFAPVELGAMPARAPSW